MPDTGSLCRRAALARLATLAGLPALAAACGRDAPDPFGPTTRPPPVGRDGRLAARPRTPTAAVPAPGRHALGIGGAGGRDATLYLPKAYRSPAPLAVLLHGSGGDAASMLGSMEEPADAHGLVLLGVDSRARTWDLLDGGEYGPDVTFLDRALAWTFARVAIDPARVGLAGFSDGASYGLALGRANGDFLGRIAAFSPGGLFVGGTPVGLPGVFLTHGRQDPYFPVDRTSRVIAQRLRDLGHAVELREFDGGHSMWPDLLVDAAAWLRG